MGRSLNCKDMIEKKDDMFAALYDYINTFDESWSKKVIPATDGKIQKLKEVSHIIENGYEFPEAYMMFLKRMGKDDGGLISKVYSGTANIDELISHYTRYGDRLYTNFEMNPNQLLFLMNEMEAEYYITYQNDGTYVITTNFDDTYNVDGFSENFEKFLFQTAFIKYERQCFEHTIYFGTNRITMERTIEKLGRNDLLAIADEIAKKNGFTKVWFSDKWTYIGVKDDASLYVNLGLALGGYITGTDLARANEHAKEVCKALGARIQ